MEAWYSSLQQRRRQNRSQYFDSGYLRRITDPSLYEKDGILGLVRR